MTSAAQHILLLSAVVAFAALAGGGNGGNSGNGGNGGGNSGNGGNGGGNGGNSGKGGAPLTRLKLVSSSVRHGKAVTFEVTLSAATRIEIEILRYVPASGHGRHRVKAHYTSVGTLSHSAVAGLNTVRVLRLGRRTLPAGRYEAKVTAGGVTDTITFSITR